MGKKLVDFGIMLFNDWGILEIIFGCCGFEGIWNKNNCIGNIFIKNLGEDL